MRRQRLSISLFLAIAIISVSLSCNRSQNDRAKNNQQKAQVENDVGVKTSVSKAQTQPEKGRQTENYRRLMSRAKEIPRLRPRSHTTEEVIQNIKERAALKKEVDKVFKEGKITSEQHDNIILELQGMPPHLSGGRGSYLNKIWGDDFEDGKLSGWTTKRVKKASSWLVENGRCVGKGVGVLLTQETNWSNYLFEVKAKILEFSHPQADCRIIVRHQATQKKSKGYHFLLGNNGVVVGTVVNGKYNALFSKPFKVKLNKWYSLKVLVKRDNIGFYVDNILLGSFYDSTYSFGGVGLGVAYAHVQFDDLVVKELK